MIFAFVSGLLTYVGAAITLKAYTAEKISLKQTTLVQVAASVVTLVAPAGIGPAALNLRFLQKHKVSTPVAIATVSLVQVAQFVTTILLLVILGLVTGNIGSFSVPSGTIVVVFLGVVLAVGVVFLVGPARRRPFAAWCWPAPAPRSANRVATGSRPSCRAASRRWTPAWAWPAWPPGWCRRWWRQALPHPPSPRPRP